MAMSDLGRARPGVVVYVVLTLALGPAFWAPVSAVEGGGVIWGFLLQDDTVTRLAGAKVTVINVATGDKFVSNVTGGNGAYEVSGLPPGTYDLGVEMAGAVYVIDSLVEVAENQRVTLSLSLQPKKPDRKLAGDEEMPVGTAVALTFKGAPTAATRDGFWASRGGITLLSVLGAGVLFVIFDDDGDADVSPSTP